MYFETKSLQSFFYGIYKPVLEGIHRRFSKGIFEKNYGVFSGTIFATKLKLIGCSGLVSQNREGKKSYPGRMPDGAWQRLCSKWNPWTSGEFEAFNFWKESLKAFLKQYFKDFLVWITEKNVEEYLRKPMTAIFAEFLKKFVEKSQEEIMNEIYYTILGRYS